MKKYGKCRICGKETRLTYEHIPPRSANNKTRVDVLTGESLIKLVTDSERLPWDKEKLAYKIKQKGMGVYSLCNECNNDTGSYYGTDYVGFANETINYFASISDNIFESNTFVTKLKIHPLRFIKQVLSMFCSTTPGLIETYPELKDILLDKELIMKQPNFKVSMYFLKSITYSWSGQIGMHYNNNNEVRIVSCLDLFPFGFVFDYDKNIIDERLMDITDFLTYNYETLKTFQIKAPMYERVMPFPLDFRSKEEYLKTLEKND